MFISQWLLTKNWNKNFNWKLSITRTGSYYAIFYSRLSSRHGREKWRTKRVHTLLYPIYSNNTLTKSTRPYMRVIKEKILYHCRVSNTIFRFFWNCCENHKKSFISFCISNKPMPSKIAHITDIISLIFQFSVIALIKLRSNPRVHVKKDKKSQRVKWNQPILLHLFIFMLNSTLVSSCSNFYQYDIYIKI